MKNWMRHNKDKQYHYMCCKYYVVSSKQTWDWEIYILHFLGKFLFVSMAFPPRTIIHCYHGNKSVATSKKGIFVHPPWVPSCMQNLKEGWKLSLSQFVWFLQRLVFKLRKVTACIQVGRLRCNHLWQAYLGLGMLCAKHSIYQGYLNIAVIKKKSYVKTVAIVWG